MLFLMSRICKKELVAAVVWKLELAREEVKEWPNIGEVENDGGS